MGRSFLALRNLFWNQRVPDELQLTTARPGDLPPIPRDFDMDDGETLRDDARSDHVVKVKNLSLWKGLLHVVLMQRRSPKTC